jgi:hypothetical protein
MRAKKLDKYSDFQAILSKELPVNGARLKFMVLLIMSLLKVQSVSFERLAQGFDREVKLGSNLRRIQRFFAKFDLCGDLIARILFKMLPLAGPFRLTLDRTNWKYGKHNINILLLGIIYKGLSVPILWVFLGDKRGNSNQKERIALLQRFINLFGRASMASLTADREFIGEEWWKFLIDHKIQFAIRMRENMQVFVPSKGILSVNWLFRSLPFNTAFHYPKIVQVGTQWVYLSGVRFVNEQGNIELLIVAAYAFEPRILAYYRQRWQIETMFKAFKTAGFNLEDTHLIDYQRLNKLLMIVALAFVWAYKIGIFQHKNVKPIAIKTHGRPEKSFFAYGLELLAQTLLNGFCKTIQIFSLLFLSCT